MSFATGEEKLGLDFDALMPYKKCATKAEDQRKRIRVLPEETILNLKKAFIR